MWIGLSLATAVFIATREALTKLAMDRTDEYRLAFGVAVFTGLLLLPVALVRGLPELSGRFWWALLVSGSVNSLAAVLIPRAVHVSDLSLVSPLQSFTPLFMLLTSPLILAEAPSLAGFTGIVAIVAGAYLLSPPEPGVERSLLAPLAALLSDRGARLMLLVAFLFSVSANVDKVGVLGSDPVFWGVCVSGFMALATFPWILRRGLAARQPPPSPGGPAGGKRLWPLLLLIGGAMALATVAQMTAITLTMAAYVIAIKRTSVVLGVLAGGFFFREKGLLRRLAGSAVMLVGVGLITLAGGRPTSPGPYPARAALTGQGAVDLLRQGPVNPGDAGQLIDGRVPQPPQVRIAIRQGLPPLGSQSLDLQGRELRQDAFPLQGESDDVGVPDVEALACEGRQQRGPLAIPPAVGVFANECLQLRRQFLHGLRHSPISSGPSALWA